MMCMANEAKRYLILGSDEGTNEPVCLDMVMAVLTNKLEGRGGERARQAKEG